MVLRRLDCAQYLLLHWLNYRNVVHTCVNVLCKKSTIKSVWSCFSRFIIIYILSIHIHEAKRRTTFSKSPENLFLWPQVCLQWEFAKFRPANILFLTKVNKNMLLTTKLLADVIQMPKYSSAKMLLCQRVLVTKIYYAKKSPCRHVSVLKHPSAENGLWTT